MERLAFLADEHVANVIVTALRSNGYDAEFAKAQLLEGIPDIDLLEAATDLGRVLLTNDRDFVTLGRGIDHAGIVVYVDQELAPGPFVRGIQAIDRQFTPGTMWKNIEWLEEWLH
ncbi:MAG: DUF5615 family PIN-like protein [Halobacteriales archaeon]|nr:DUF5615 family PIN-like protein [Halobacteriales archaeon]